MSAVFRRCGCRDNDGRQYGVLPEQPTEEQREKACPLMAKDSKHGSWTFRLSAKTDPVTGKRRQVRGGTYSTKREAQTERNKALVKLDAGKLAAPSRETVAEYLPRWLERRARVGTTKRKPLANTTLANYQRYVDDELVPSALGRVRLRDLRRGHIQAYIDDLIDAGRGAVTVRRIVATLQSALTAAVRDELIDESPARQLELPRVDKKEFKPWEPEQVGHFLDVATQHRLGAFFETAIWTGLRRAELCGLRWDDVDLAHRELRVRKSKTDAGVRRVPLSDQAAGALVAWQIAQGAEREAWGAAYEDSGYVFTMENGRPLLLLYTTRLFEKLRVRADLPEMTLHGLRHTAASLYLASGSDIEFVSKLLGHSDVRVTSSIYSHQVRSVGRERADQAAAMVPRRTVEEGAVPTSHPQEAKDAEEAASAVSGDGLRPAVSSAPPVGLEPTTS